MASEDLHHLGGVGRTAGGFVLALAGFFVTLATVDTANPYGPMGGSPIRSE